MIEFLTFLGTLLLRRSPLLLLILGVSVFAIVRWKRHPRVSLMTVIALAVYLFESFAFTFIFRWLPNAFYRVGSVRPGINIVDIALQLCEDLIYAGVLILLVAAAFTGRKEKLATQT